MNAVASPSGCSPEPAHIVEKAWGREIVYVNNEHYCSKDLVVHPGKRCSLHYHNVKDETFRVVSGVVILEVDWDLKVCWPGFTVRVRPGVAHRFGSVAGCVIHEVSTHHEDVDVVRLEQSGEVPDGWG